MYPLLHFLPLRTISTSNLGGVGAWFGVLCAYNVCLFGFMVLGLVFYMLVWVYGAWFGVLYACLGLWMVYSGNIGL